MAKTEFDKELSTYLLRRKKSQIPDIVKWLKDLMPKPTPPTVQVKLPEEIQTYEEKTKPQMKIEEETVQEYVPEQQNVLSFILDKLNRIGIKKKPKATEEEQEAKIKDIVVKEMAQKDLREIAKITLMAIKRLPEEDMKEFKESSEFGTLKKILKKHDLIK